MIAALLTCLLCRYKLIHMLKTGHIEGLPVRSKIISDAKERVSWAESSLREFELADTIAEKRQAWSQFLMNSASVYEKIRAGAKEAGGRTYQWFGQVVSERRHDPLLRYVHRARDCEYTASMMQAN